MRRLSDFEGVWKIERRIEDRLTGSPGAFRGKLTLERQEQGLLARETGTLTLGKAPPVVATRTTIWRETGHGRIAVLFEDGRPFHEISEGLRPEARHHCGEDIYNGRYDFTKWPRWVVTWDVTGPRKDYVSETVHVPCVPEAHGAEVVRER